MQITYIKNNIDCYAVYPDNKSQKEIIQLLHKSDVREQIAKYIRDNVKDLNTISDICLGYVIESMPQFYSRISNIKFHSDNISFNVKYKSQ